MNITRPEWMDCLPPILNDLIEEEVRLIQVPHEMVILPALSAISAACLGKYQVQIFSSWTEPLCLFTATIAPPGSRKTGACNMTFKPVFDLDREAAKRSEARKALIEERVNGLKNNKKVIDAEIKKTNYQNSPQLFQQAADLKIQIQELEDQAKTKSLIWQDVTPEAIVDAMQANDGKIAILSDEGEFLQICSGRYSGDGKAQIEGILKAYYGSVIKQKRIGRGEISIESAQAVIGIMIQPRVWDDAMDDPEFRSKGFLGRFLYSRPPNVVGYREYKFEPETPGLKEAWNQAIERIWYDDKKRNILFSGDAMEDFMDWLQFIEYEQKIQGYLYGITDWASKIGGTVARIAAMFSLLEGEDCISKQSARRAIALADTLLIPQALEVLGGEDGYQLQKYSLMLLNMIKNGATRHKDVRDKNRAFRTAEDFLTHLRPLLDEQYVLATIEEVNGRQYERFSITDLGERVLAGGFTNTLSAEWAAVGAKRADSTRYAQTERKPHGYGVYLRRVGGVPEERGGQGEMGSKPAPLCGNGVISGEHSGQMITHFCRAGKSGDHLAKVFTDRSTTTKTGTDHLNMTLGAHNAHGPGGDRPENVVATPFDGDRDATRYAPTTLPKFSGGNPDEIRAHGTVGGVAHYAPATPERVFAPKVGVPDDDLPEGWGVHNDPDWTNIEEVLGPEDLPL